MADAGAAKKLTATEKFHLKHFLKELAGYKGRHTEFVSVYVPAGYDLNAIINHLQIEQGTAGNIKSKQTRTNVQDALERMIQYLKGVARTIVPIPRAAAILPSGSGSEDVVQGQPTH